AQNQRSLDYVFYVADVHCAIVVLIFFFQAEDGIRDYKVTGVQTCALPISGDGRRVAPRRRRACGSATRVSGGQRVARRQRRRARSEERRVGKECRARWSPWQ